MVKQDILNAAKSYSETVSSENDEFADYAEKDFKEGVKWFVITSIEECKEQILICEVGKSEYEDDPDQVLAFNNKIKYFQFMIARLERFI